MALDLALLRGLFENLMRVELESAEDLEVVVSVVEIPPNTRLPVHKHPGEEFAYIMEGSLVLWQQGKGETRLRAGTSGTVPLNQVHTTYTEDEPAKLVAFRVHKKGAPERILVEELPSLAEVARRVPGLPLDVEGAVQS